MISNMHRNHQMRTKYILTLIIFVLQTINMQAQHYVYSVTIGTSWARQVFPGQERAQRKKLEPQLYPSSRRWCETDATINTIRSIRDI